MYTDHLSQHAASLFSALFAINCWVIVEKKNKLFNVQISNHFELCDKCLFFVK